MELIGIREAARRLGVSDTAVHKAIKAGRVHIAGRTEGSERPLVAWPQVETDWSANTDGMKRSHIGPKAPPAPASRAQVAIKTVAKKTRMLPASEGGGSTASAPAPADPQPTPTGPSYAQSRAIREAYQARLAKLEYEERSKKLIDADQVKIEWFKLITAAKTRILGIPAACKTRVADLPLTVMAAIDQVCREALEDLANERD